MNQPPAPPAETLENPAIQVLRQVFDLAAQGALDLSDLLAVNERLIAAGNIPLAADISRIWLAHTTSPLAHLIWFQLGAMLAMTGDQSGVEEAFRQARRLDPTFLRATFALGQELERQGRTDETIDLWREIEPQIDTSTPDGRAFAVTVLNNLGRILDVKTRILEAEHVLAKSLALDPQQPVVVGERIRLRQYLCLWPVEDAASGLTAAAMIDGIKSFSSLSACDDPEIQLAASRRFLEHPFRLKSGLPALSERRDYGHDRLRIGYMSSDFRWHAVSLLTAELLELHDRTRVEVFGFCWTANENSAMRKRMIAAMDHHVPIGPLDDEEAARLIRSLEIDVLVDLHGLATQARPNILSHRPAPVQVTYLGYPGSTGHPDIDYVIADDYLIPEETLPWTSETPIRLPTVFQVSDRKRGSGERPSRASCGLPEDAFVFCSFSNTHKITPELFSVWMSILRRCPNSVLWLLADNGWAQENMTRHAERQGVPPSRLIFTGRVLPQDYLARYQIADLFLDTFPFNAGTTANDALWMGLPVLTRSGRTFASRMAGSLLRAAGLLELIATTPADYEEKAVAHAHTPDKARALRRFLEEGRDTNPLFDIPKIVREIEDAFIARVRGLGKPAYVGSPIRVVPAADGHPGGEACPNLLGRP